jgi:hypothetical protein
MRLFHISSPQNAAIPGTGLIIKLPMESEQSACWDAATGFPVRIETGTNRLELGAYSAMGDKQFPHKLRDLRDGKPLIEAELDSLELLDVKPLHTRAGWPLHLESSGGDGTSHSVTIHSARRYS